jgi:hypothetical protein
MSPAKNRIERQEEPWDLADLVDSLHESVLKGA